MKCWTFASLTLVVGSMDCDLCQNMWWSVAKFCMLLSVADLKLYMGQSHQRKLISVIAYGHIFATSNPALKLERGIGWDCEATAVQGQCLFQHEISMSGKVTTVTASSVNQVFSFSLMLALHSEPEGNKWTSINHAHQSFSCSHRIKHMKEVRIQNGGSFHLWPRPYLQELQVKWNHFCTLLLIKSHIKYWCHTATFNRRSNRVMINL